jgi:hypothetical protein
LSVPILPTQYTDRAAELERLAARIINHATRASYLELASELRRLAEHRIPWVEQTDEQVEQLAERIVGSSVSEL